MICYPEEGASIARELAVIVCLEVGHDLDSLGRICVRTRATAVRDAEAKNNLHFN
jgi:hypothetical protein